VTAKVIMGRMPKEKPRGNKGTPDGPLVTSERRDIVGQREQQKVKI